MTNFASDHETIQALQELTELIQKGLQDAWNPEIINQAKQQVESIENKIQKIESNLTGINLQKDELEKAIKVATQLDSLIQKLGGTNKIKQDLAKLEDLNQVLNQISSGAKVAESLHQQTQVSQEIITPLIEKIDRLGGADTLMERFGQLQEIAQRLGTLDNQIQSSIDSCLNTYLPNFEAGKYLIEQWREETLLETQNALAKMKKTAEELEKSESELQSILNSIAQLTQSLGGKTLFNTVVNKLADLDDFWVTEKSALNKFKNDLEEALENEIEEVIHKNEGIFIQKLTELNNVIISAKAEVNELQTKIEASINKLQKQLETLIASECKRLNAQNKNELKKELRDEFQNLIHQEIEVLETKYLQEIDRLDQENKRLKKSFGLTSIGLFGR